MGKLRTEFDYWQDSTCLLPTRDCIRGFEGCDCILDRPLKVPSKKSEDCSQSCHSSNFKVAPHATQSCKTAFPTTENLGTNSSPLGDNRRVIGDPKTPDQYNLYNDITYIDKKCTKNVQKVAKSGQASGKVLPKKVPKFSELSREEQADFLIEDAE